MFLEHLIKKNYQALAEKPVCLPSRSFSVDDFLARISPKSAAGKWGAVKTGGEHAHTDFRLLEEHRAFLRILAMPVTGRTHQIRVHLAGLGMPLLGDVLYGGPAKIGSLQCARSMLHAETLTFPHPVGGKEISVTAPLPEDFLACLK